MGKWCAFMQIAIPMKHEISYDLYFAFIYTQNMLKYCDMYKTIQKVTLYK